MIFRCFNGLPTPDGEQAGDGNRRMVYIHHTDSLREWAYDRESHIWRLDKGLDEANEKSWIIADMKNDWQVIYPSELNK